MNPWTGILVFIWMLSAAASTLAAPRDAQTSEPRLPANFNLLPGPQAVVPMPFEVVDPNPAAVRLRFFDPPVEINSVSLNGAEYEAVRMTGEGSTLEPGAPELPAVRRSIMISNYGNVELSILDQSYTISELALDVAPAQPMELETTEGPVAQAFAAPDPGVYGQDAWYPPVVARISQPAALRDLRFVVVEVCPVQVNPVTHQLRVYNNLELLIENVGGIGPSEIEIIPTTLSPSFKRLYETFENFEGSALDELPVLPGKYLAICPNNATAISETERLVAWKKRRGLDAYYVTTTTAGTTNTAIRNYIVNQYTASGGTLEYVCLVGDPSTSSAHVIPTFGGSQLDNYYGAITGGPNPDPVPDIAVGRITPVDNVDLVAIINKTINYESNPYYVNTDWFTRTWCAAHTSIHSNPSTKEYTRQIMLQHGIPTVYWNTYSGHVSTSDISNRLSTGISVFNHRMGWISEILNGDVDSNTPITPMQPFVMSVTCGTGNFDGDGTSEHWLRPGPQTATEPRGAIGCVGMWGSSTHVPFNNVVDAGTMYGIYVTDVGSQGMALVAGKLELYRNYQVSHPTDVANFSAWSNLMGDPAVPIWRFLPRQATVTRPTSVNRGTNNVSVTVVRQDNAAPIEGALVCLLKGTETYTRGYTNASGQINLPCSTATTGSLHITITHEQMRPYVDSIQVVNALASLALQSVGVDDDNIGGTVGDNNDVLNSGETVDLSLVLTNAGTTSTVTGISGTLTTTSPGVQVTQANSTYPNIAPGANASPVTAFRVVVTSVFENEPATFFLNLNSSVGAQTVRVDLVPRTGDVVYVSSAFSGPGGNTDPGETGNLTVNFRNAGSRTLISSAGILRSLDPMVQVTDSVGTFGTVAASATATNAGNPFAIAISPGSYNGHRAVMELVITDANGFRDSTLFDSTHFTTTPSNFYLTLGTQSATSPTGPDTYGYFAFDNTETQPPNSGSIYEWIEIQTTGTSLNFNDTYEDADQSVTLNLPFPFTFYGQSFSQITVCTNGWLAFGSYPIDDFRNYRMGSPIGPPFQVAAYWDDLKCWGAANNCYYWYNATDHYYVVEWRAQTLWTSVNEFFEIILYDPAYYPSGTGDGKIKVQYQQVTLSPNSGYNDNDYASVGIQNGDHSIGLDYYYWNQYSAGSASLIAGRSIMYTTDATGQLNPELHVTQPAGGEQWFVGQQYSLQWQTTAVSGNVNIELKRNYPGGAWETLFANTGNDGIEPWTVTGPAMNNTARIRITSILNPAIGDTSTGTFSIISPTATVTYPNGGEFLQTGNWTTITWTTVGLGPVRVELNRDYPGPTWETLTPFATTELPWTVSGSPTTHARIRIVGVNLPTVGDTSNADFTIGIAPSIVHDPHADADLGAATFVAYVTDDAPGFVTKLFYRAIGAGSYDSLTLAATGNPDEYAAMTPALGAATYEYYLRASDPQQLVRTLPETGTYRFDVGAVGSNWLAYDDGTAENYNWVDGPNFKWAVKFEPASYPYLLNAGRFAICPTCPGTRHDRIIFEVMLADGPGGLPGTVVFTDTTGSPGNVIGGLPAGAAWAEVITRVGGNPLSLNGPFYLCVENMAQHLHPAAFATDTSATRNHRSFIWDECLGQWLNEDAVAENTRPGDRMIRASGFNLAPPSIVAFRTDEGPNTSITLRWIANGSPYYRVYSGANAQGPFDTLEGSVVGPSSGTPVLFLDSNAVNQGIRRFYRVVASDQP